MWVRSILIRSRKTYDNGLSRPFIISEPYHFHDGIFLPQSDRLQILSPEEYELLWGLPRFSEYDRNLFFSITPREKQLLRSLKSARAKTHFLLALGYFRVEIERPGSRRAHQATYWDRASVISPATSSPQASIST